MNIVSSKVDKNGDVYLDLKDILKNSTTRISTVKYYNIETKDNNIILTLFNKNKKKIKIRYKK